MTRSTLESLCDVWMPDGGPLPAGARSLGVPKQFEDLVSRGSVDTRLLVRLATAVCEAEPFFSSAGRRLSRADPEAAAKALESWMDRGGLAGALPLLMKHLLEGLYSYTPPFRDLLGVTLAPLPAATPLPPVAPAPRTIDMTGVGVTTTLTCDACIIGSGAGGAPVAALLAEAGWDVLVLEEGGSYGRDQFQGNPLGRMVDYYRGNGVLVTMGRPMVQVVEAAAVGGTTVFNSGSCFRTPEPVLHEWEKGLRLPNVSLAQLDPYFERVERFLQVGIPDAAILGQNAEVARVGASALRLPDHGIIRRPAPGCRGSDECVLGCPTDAKRSMALSYLPRALAAGARIASRTQVRRVRPLREGEWRWAVEGVVRGGSGGAAGIPVVVRARNVVLSAGALHTPYLLPPSGDRRARRHRGRHLRLHPSFEVAGELDRRVQGWEGVLQSYYIEDRSRRILLEATFQPRGLVSTAGLLPLSGPEYKAFLPRLSHLAILGGMVSEEGEGRLLPTLAGRGTMRYDLTPEDLLRVGAAMALAGRVLLAAGSKRVYLPLGGGRVVRDEGALRELEKSPPRPSSLHLFAFHPLGTARMAGEPELGAVDPEGRVWGTEGLFVSDASLLPGSPTVNPMISIIALAEQHADRWVKQGVGAG